MTRKLAFLAVCLAVLPTPATPVGLGEIELKSTLNQPLSADVELLSVTAEDLLDLNVELASVEAFSKANLQRSSVLNNLRFEVIQTSGDQGVIRVTSRQPVREPFLDLLLRVNWPGGQLVREYTVLVDPPALMPAPAPQVQAAVTGLENSVDTAPAAPQYAGAVASATTVEVPLKAIPTQRTTVAGEYTTKSGDTLWSIARQLRPNRSIKPQQMILALQRHNPHAFRGTVNQLKVGVTLQVPDLTEITALTSDEAAAEVDRQEVVWRNQQARQAGLTTVKGKAEPVKSAERPPAPAVDQVTEPAKDTGMDEGQGRLKLIPPENESPKDVELQALVAGSGDTGNLDAEYLSKELALAVEAAEGQRRESEALRSSLAQVQKQMEDMRRLVAINEEELVQLRSRLAAGSNGQLSAEMATIKEEPMPFAALVREVMGSPVLKTLVSVIAVLMLALVWVVARQRKLEQERLVPITDMPAETPVSVATEVKTPQSETTVDPVSEADVYIAYGRYDQAAELITNALKLNPGRKDLSFKLLEIHYFSKNQRDFDALATALKANIDDENDPAWAQVVLMGQSLSPANPLFQSAGSEDSGRIVNEMLDGIPADASAPDLGDPPAMESDIGEMDWDLEFGATGTGDSEPVSGIVHDQELELEPEITSAADTEQPFADFSGDQLEDDVAIGGGFEFELEPKLELEPEEPFVDNGLLKGSSTVDQNTELPETEDNFDAVVDEISTKLDLAGAYFETGDWEGARNILKEVVAEGNDQQKQQAAALLEKIS